MWDRGASAGTSFIRLINNSRSPGMAEESTQRQVTSLLVRRSRTLEFLHFRAPKGRPIPAQANEGVKKSLVAGSCAETAMHQSTRSRHSTLEEFSTCAPHLRILNLIT